MKILFLTQLFPYPPICGGTIRSCNILRHLGEKHEVVLVSFVREDPTAEQMGVAASFCSEVHTVPIRRSAAANMKFAAKSLFSRKPFIIARDQVVGMQHAIDGLLEPGGFDMVYVDHLQMAQYMDRWDHIPWVLDEHNVEWKIIERMAQSERFSGKGLYASIEWKKLKEWELSACEKAGLVLTVTETDKATLLRECRDLGNVTCIPIGVDFDSFPKAGLSPNARNILSIGTMSWPPNIDSILYFADEIYPEIKSRSDGVKLVIAGSKPAGSIRKLPSMDSSIEVTGFVQDLSALMSEAAVFIVPLRSGSGLRVKILNAMAMGLPVVSTSVGCEGIGAENGRHLLIADTPQAFADSVLRLLSDFELRKQLAEVGREFVLSNYGWDSILARLDKALDALVLEKHNYSLFIRRKNAPPPIRMKNR
ncbi:MAG: glycosyltransferase family 4 protein [Armatimonadota bacterium]